MVMLFKWLIVLQLAFSRPPAITLTDVSEVNLVYVSCLEACLILISYSAHKRFKCSGGKSNTLSRNTMKHGGTKDPRV